jgi:hypothetical protein
MIGTVTAVVSARPGTGRAPGPERIDATLSTLAGWE